MRTLLRIILLLIVVAAVGTGVGYLYLQDQFSTAYPSTATPTIIEIPRGMGNREILRMLHERNIIANEDVAVAYLVYSGNRGRLRAGEYMFDRPMTVAEVVEKLVRGNVYLHRFTAPEGLTLKATARKWEEQGFGTADEFVSAASNAVSLIHDLDPKAESLEGYLFPETYSFPRGTTAHQAVESMILRFKSIVNKLKEVAPPEQWPMPLRETVILASLVETEAAHADERSIVASVYLNRLARNILLQCDPTVIYALERDNMYKGRLTLADLRYDSPYNTYRYAGLPPGPITNPGYAALQAAVKPDSTNYLFFVRTVGGRHTFSENLAAHNRAVREYRALQRRGN
jgi:UPF0755 protein